MNLENGGETPEHFDSRVLLSPFDPAQVTKVELGLQRELFLREVKLLAETPNVPAGDLFPRHSAQ